MPTNKRKMSDRELSATTSISQATTRFRRESVMAELAQGKILLRRDKGTATLNPFCCGVLEPKRKIFYKLGGSRPGSADRSHDFFAYHILENTWYNHTNDVRYVLSPGGVNASRSRPKRPIPPLFNAAGHPFYNGDSRSLIIFGGLNPDDTPSADFISINLDEEEPVWSKLAITGGLIKPRDGPCMTIIGNKMYIFGGFIGDESSHTRTFSVAEYREPGGWIWVIRDRPYPRHVKKSHWVRLNIHQAFEGRKIVLVAGEEKANKQVRTDRSKLILFDVRDHTFEPMDTVTGNFPHTKIGFDLSTLSTWHSPAHSILIGGFQNRRTKYCYPELWKCQLDPEQKCNRLPVSNVLAKLDLCMQLILTSGNHCYIIGAAPDRKDVNVSLTMTLETLLQEDEQVVDRE